ncbi:Zn-dependent hydrolase [Candidatus Woesearchaeota archaeon]|nr:Zn-dependent hydrolase [Candidatus Woesearchaeota archaeon]|tara:strand:+ start:1713 stop:2345 length:633 start_codon:yes stop_codon:yes gene_type:complete
MFFKQIPVGPMQNFIYLIGDEASKEAAIVDAGWDIDKLIETANNEKLQIKKIILTHSHYDHVQKVSELADKTKAEIYFHELEIDEIKRSIKNEIKFIKLKDNEEIKVGNIKIKIIHTPGHTIGAICLLFENKLITGDTLFVSAIGRTDLPGGNPIQLFESLQKLKKLDDNIEIYPGHDYGSTPSSTIGDEKKNNPYFKCNTKEEFMNLMS